MPKNVKKREETKELGAVGKVMSSGLDQWHQLNVGTNDAIRKYAPLTGKTVGEGVKLGVPWLIDAVVASYSGGSGAVVSTLIEKVVPVKGEVAKLSGTLAGFLTTAALDALVEASEGIHEHLYGLLHAALTGEKSTHKIGLPSTRVVRERAQALVALLATNEATQPVVDHMKKALSEAADKKAKEIMGGAHHKRRAEPSHEENASEDSALKQHRKH